MRTQHSGLPGSPQDTGLAPFLDEDPLVPRADGVLGSPLADVDGLKGEVGAGGLVGQAGLYETELDGRECWAPGRGQGTSKRQSRVDRAGPVMKHQERWEGPRRERGLFLTSGRAGDHLLDWPHGHPLPTASTRWESNACPRWVLWGLVDITGHQWSFRMEHPWGLHLSPALALPGVKPGKAHGCTSNLRQREMISPFPLRAARMESNL